MHKNGITKDYKLFRLQEDDGPKFQTKNWHIINDQNNGQYGKADESETTVKFNNEVVKHFLVDYSDVYILMTGDIKVVGGNNNTLFTFKNYHLSTRSLIFLNDE